MSVDVSYLRGLDSKRRPPIVRFKQRSKLDKILTEKRGLSTYVDEDAVEITSPNGGVTITKTIADWFAEMAADPANYMTWAPAYRQMYEDWKRNHDTTAADGVHIKNWSLPSPAQTETLVNAGITTIEKVAAMPDDLVSHIDGGAYLRSKARYWLNASEDVGAVATEAASLRADNDTLRAQVEDLGRKLAEAQAEIKRLTDHFTGKEGYDIIAGRAQAVGLKIVADAEPAVQPPEPEAPAMIPAPSLKSLEQLQSLSMPAIREYAYEQNVKPSNSKDETIERLREAGAIA